MSTPRKQLLNDAWYVRAMTKLNYDPRIPESVEVLRERLRRLRTNSAT
jgi:hypothetical protein